MSIRISYNRNNDVCIRFTNIDLQTWLILHWSVLCWQKCYTSANMYQIMQVLKWFNYTHFKPTACHEDATTCDKVETNMGRHDHQKHPNSSKCANHTTSDLPNKNLQVKIKNTPMVWPIKAQPASFLFPHDRRSRFIRSNKTQWQMQYTFSHWQWIGCPNFGCLCFHYATIVWCCFKFFCKQHQPPFETQLQQIHNPNTCVQLSFKRSVDVYTQKIWNPAKSTRNDSMFCCTVCSPISVTSIYPAIQKEPRLQNSIKKHDNGSK